MAWSEKRWHYVAVTGPQGIVSAAVANLGYLGLGFAYFHDRASGKTQRFELKTPLGLGAHVMYEPDEAFSRFSVPQGLIRIDTQPARLTVRARAFEADFELAPAAPFDVGWRIESAGPHRTRKRMGGRGTGVVRVDGRELPMTGGVLWDWSRGELARETSWRWAAGAGMAGSRTLGWNLRTGFDDPLQVENVVWVDGMPEPIGAVEIVPGTPWLINSPRLKLKFMADGEHREDLDLGLLTSRYTQPWGRFEGTWDGEPVTGSGVMEDHQARW